MSKNFAFTVWKEGDNYVAQCLNVDVSSFGSTYEEALDNTTEALELYLEDTDFNEIESVEVPSLVMKTITK